MESNLIKFKKELNALLAKGKLLSYSMFYDLQLYDEATRKKIDRKDLPDFKDEYEQWYSAAMQVVRQLLPDRLLDFVRLYKDEKRKEIDDLTYGVSDYMIGLTIERSGRVVVHTKAAAPKFLQQIAILKAAHERLETALYDMVEIVQGDLFDNELDAAAELTKKKFLRGGGAIAGVVLERHLCHICEKRKITCRKKNPTISDFNEALKGAGVIDVATWRFIQHLGDLRNLCDHNKGTEPSADEVNALIAGVRKVTKTLL